jgi:predicted  nucleic acid-binding Zn-ribbon protein
MRVRHRIPSIFNLSMVDVMCCALGCVILLWLLNLRQAKEEEQKATDLRATAKKDREDALQEIDRRKASIASLEKDAAALRADLIDRASRIGALEKQVRDGEDRVAALTQAVAAGEVQLRATRAAADKRALDLETARTALDKKATDLGGRLSEADRKLLEMAAQLAAADKRGKELQPLADLVPGLRASLLALQLKMAETTKDSDARLSTAARSLDDLKAARAAAELALKRQTDELALARSFEGKWKASEEKLSLLAKDIAASKTTLAAADRDVIALRNDKRSLESEVVRIRQAADNRFAGITLTGRRVVFLVDMSGSMELVDEKTPAPQKWSEVRETLLKVMKSLPDLEKYQIIVFEEKAAYLLGKPEEWIDYNAKTSLPLVEASMKALKPHGGTNMYAALEAAFRYRPRGLDTIYLLSDGLPNAGDGVPDAEARRLLELNREPELSDRLAKHIRKTLKASWNREVLNERVRINAIGFFYESPDVGAFLWALARENDGSFVGMSKP